MSSRGPHRFKFNFFIFVAAFVCSAGVLAHAQESSSDVHAATQNDPFAHALIALKESRFDAALADLTAAEAERPGDARVRNFRGIALASLGRYTEAAAEYREAIRLDPATGDAYRNLGFLEWTQHQLEAAATHLARALELSPGDSFSHYYLGRVHLEALRYREAFAELERSHVSWPDEPDFLIQAATGYAALARQADARGILDRLTTLPLSETQSVRVAAMLVNLHQAGAALAMLQKLKQEDLRNKPWLQFDLAMAYLSAANYDQAASEAHLYVDGLHSSDAAGSAWSLIGIASAHLARRDQAVDAFRRATTLAPTQEENWLNLTRELMELGRYSEAISAVQDGLASNPQSYALHLRMGAAYLAAGRYPDAEKSFRTLVTAGDPLPTSYVGLAQVLLRTGRAGEAASELAIAQQKLGSTFLISYFRGLALERAGKSTEAGSAFQDAVRLNPGSPDAHLGLGKTELAQGHIAGATTELEEALRLDPGNVQAQRLLSQAYRRVGDVNHAVKYAEASAQPAAEKTGDLVGDFFLPEWQMPPQSDNP